MFSLSSTTYSFGVCKLSPNAPCISIPKNTHTDHLGHHPQIKKLQKGAFAHWYLNLEKKHSEVYDAAHNFLNQNKHLRTFINRRFGTAQPLKVNTYVLIVKKLHKSEYQKRSNHKKLDLTKFKRFLR